MRVENKSGFRTTSNESMHSSNQSSTIYYVSFCDQPGLKTCWCKELIREENKWLIARLLMDSWSDWLKYIEKKSAFLIVFFNLTQAFHYSLLWWLYLAFRLFLAFSIVNSQIAMIVTNYNLSVTVGIIIERQWLGCGKILCQWQILLCRFLQAESIIWPHFKHTR